MSLILDALRKSERDRRASEAPSPASLVADDAASRAGWPIWAVVLLVIINASVLAGLWWFGRAQVPAPITAPVATGPAPSAPLLPPTDQLGAVAPNTQVAVPAIVPPPAASATQPATPPVPVASPAAAQPPPSAAPAPAPAVPPVPVAPAQQAATQVPPAQAMPAAPMPPANRQPVSPKMGQRPIPNGRYREEAAAGAYGTASPQQQAPQVDEEELDLEEEDVDTEEAAGEGQMPAAKSPADLAPEPEQPLTREALQRLARQKGWSDAPPPLQQPAVRPAPLRRDDAPVAHDDNIPSVDGLPASLQEKVPALKMNLHAYAKLPSERFAVINSQRYEIGGSLPGGAQVIDIRPDGVILQIEGTPFKLKR